MDAYLGQRIRSGRIALSRTRGHGDPSTVGDIAIPFGGSGPARMVGHQDALRVG